MVGGGGGQRLKDAHEASKPTRGPGSGQGPRHSRQTAASHVGRGGASISESSVGAVLTDPGSQTALGITESWNIRRSVWH